MKIHAYIAILTELQILQLNKMIYSDDIDDILFSILAELLLVVHLVHATSDAVIVTPPPSQCRLHSSTFQRSRRTVETIHNLCILHLLCSRIYYKLE